MPDFEQLIFKDTFDNESYWQTGEKSNGTISLGINELTLVATQNDSYLYSLREKTRVDDFYLEVTANPTICQGEDEYGILIRVTPSMEFIRYGLSCNGYARVDRFYDGLISAPQPPTMAGAIPPGAPSTSVLGVLAKGKDISFYANNQFLFSIREANLYSGTVGVFIRTKTSQMMTVNFSKLFVYAINQ